MTFVLAHLSDPHLAPLPQPRLFQLIGKRATGLVNWRRKREAIHRPEVLARIVADLKAQTRRITSRSPAISSIWRCRRNTRRRAPGSMRSARRPT